MINTSHSLMTVSVIVPTYNGAHKLPNILQALAKQSSLPNEIIIVVDGSNDNTLEVLQPYQERMANLRVITQENKGRAAVRNRGAEEAKGQLLIFFDDDMRPQPICIAEHIAHHHMHLGSIAVGMQQDEALPHDTDFQSYKVAMVEKWLRTYAEMPAQTPMDPARLFVSAANLSMPAELFNRIQGFDNVLRDIEDFDLGMRASEEGISIFFLRNAVAWHDDKVTCKKYISRLREYRNAHKVLAGLRPSLYNKYVPRSPEPPTGIKGAVFRLMANPTVIDLIDSGSLSILPKPVRHKLIDLVITAQGSYLL